MLIVQAQALIDAGPPSTLIIPLTTQLIGDAEPPRLRVQAQGKLRKDSDLPHLSRGIRDAIAGAEGAVAASMGPRHLSRGIRFLHSVKDAAASEKAAAAIVQAVTGAFHANPTLNRPGVTVEPQAGPGAGQLTPTLERNEYLQLATVLCHFFELRLIVQEDL